MNYLHTAVANSYDDGDARDDDCSGFRDKPARRRRMQISSRRADPRKISTSSNWGRRPPPNSLTQHLCSFSTNSRPRRRQKARALASRPRDWWRYSGKVVPRLTVRHQDHFRRENLLLFGEDLEESHFLCSFLARVQVCLFAAEAHEPHLIPVSTKEREGFSPYSSRNRKGSSMGDFISNLVWEKVKFHPLVVSVD